jgi:hypothetical protein
VLGLVREPSSTGCALALRDHVAREAAVIAARYVRFRVVVVGSAVRMGRAYLAGGSRRKNPASGSVQVTAGHWCLFAFARHVDAPLVAEAVDVVKVTEGALVGHQNTTPDLGVIAAPVALPARVGWVHPLDVECLDAGSL